MLTDDELANGLRLCVDLCVELTATIERLQRIELAARAVLAAWEADTWTQGKEYVEEMCALHDALQEEKGRE